MTARRLPERGRSAEYAALIASGAVTFSGALRPMAESPLAAHDAMTVGRDSGDTAARSCSRYTHALILEGTTAGSRWAIWPDGKNRVKTSAEYIDAVARTGNIPLKAAEIRKALAIARSVRTLCGPTLRKIIGDGRIATEIALHWQETVDGLDIDCAGVLDALVVKPDGEAWVLDCKEVSRIDARALDAHLARSQYPTQIAHYMAGGAKLPGVRTVRGAWIVYESAAPHDATVIFAQPADVREVFEPWRQELLSRIVALRRDGVRHGKCPDGRDFVVPSWFGLQSGVDLDAWGDT